MSSRPPFVYRSVLAMGLLFVLLRIMVRAAMPTPRCVHGQHWSSCALCKYAARRDPFRRPSHN